MSLARPFLPLSKASERKREYVSKEKPRGGGTLGISGWGCAARTLEPLAYTRANFSWILVPYTRVNSLNHSWIPIFDS